MSQRATGRPRLRRITLQGKAGQIEIVGRPVVTERDGVRVYGFRIEQATHYLPQPATVWEGDSFGDRIELSLGLGSVPRD